MGVNRPHLPNQKVVLGIETSCDETAVALVRLNVDGTGDILANQIYSQLDEHKAFGGVVPEIAARAHIQKISPLVQLAAQEARIELTDIDAVAATAGPGLLGGVLVGLTMARGLAYGLDKPMLNINHLEGHALTAMLTDKVSFPFLLLLVSGGHSQIILVKNIGDYQLWGTTIDDALGEAFDKVAKLLGLGYPGGPFVERFALKGDEKRFDFPRPLIKSHLLTKTHDKGASHLGQLADLNFSFSGLKTAVRRTAQMLEPLGEQDVADICASFQAAICDCLEIKVAAAMQKFEIELDQKIQLVVAGGVAANKKIAHILHQLTTRFEADLYVPPAALCTDNAVMIAWAGALRSAMGQTDDLSQKAAARWPLADLQPPL